MKISFNEHAPEFRSVSDDELRMCAKLCIECNQLPLEALEECLSLIYKVFNKHKLNTAQAIVIASLLNRFIRNKSVILAKLDPTKDLFSPENEALEAGYALNKFKNKNKNDNNINN